MRGFNTFPLGLAGFAALLSPQAFAQPAEAPDEIIVRGKPLSQFRLEVEQARDAMVELFNEANEDDDTDIRCRDEAPTGTRIPQSVCWSKAQDRASANAAGKFLNGLLMGMGSVAQGAENGMGAGQEAAAAGANAAVRVEREWQRVMETSPQFRAAVVNYRELQGELDRASGAAVRIPIPSFTLSGPQCEASTYIEYEQHGNVARVSGRVSVSACPAGTTGKFAVVANVRDEAGARTPLEFGETWQRADALDHSFSSDYPIGDDVLLESVRVRNLRCDCADRSE